MRISLCCNLSLCILFLNTSRKMLALSFEHSPCHYIEKWFFHSWAHSKADWKNPQCRFHFTVRLPSHHHHLVSNVSLFHCTCSRAWTFCLLRQPQVWPLEPQQYMTYLTLQKHCNFTITNCIKWENGQIWICPAGNSLPATWTSRKTE